MNQLTQRFHVVCDIQNESYRSSPGITSPLQWQVVSKIENSTRNLLKNTSFLVIHVWQIITATQLCDFARK